MSADLATLALRLTNAQAIADAKATGAAYVDMGEKGEAAARKLTLSTNPVTSAIKNQTIASVEATRGMSAWAAIQAEAAGHVGSHSLAIGRLERNLAMVAERALGVNSTIGLMGSSLLKFGIGSIETVGILAGIAAIAAAWEYFTGAARKAREENDKLVQSLESGNFRAALGPDPDLVLSTSAQRNTLMQERERKRVLLAFGAKPDDQRIIDLNVEIAHSQSVLEDGERRLFKARMDATKPLDTVVTRAKDYTAEMMKQQELLIRFNELMNKTYGLDRAPMAMTSADRASWMSSARGRTMTDTELSAATAGIGTVPDATMPNMAIKQLLNSYDVRHAQVVKQLTEAYEDAKAPFKSVTAAVNDFKDGLKSAATGLLEQLSPSNLAQGLLNSATQQVQGWIKGMISGAIGGIRHALFGESGAEKDAARQAADSARAMALQIDAVTKSLGGDQLGAAIDALKIGLISTLQGINDALPGTANESQRNALRAQATAQEAQQEALARRAAAEQARYATEDLAVRNLRATGQGSQADLLSFQNQQAREMQAALDANKDATYLSYLATVQNNELLAFQNGLLSTAMRNEATGFYGIAAYLGQFATPRGPAGYPTDGGVTGGGADNSNNGLTPPGGRSTPPSNRGPITIILTLDGRVVTRTVVANFDQTAAATGGAGSSRATGMELYR